MLSSKLIGYKNFQSIQDLTLIIQDVKPVLPPSFPALPPPPLSFSGTHSEARFGTRKQGTLLIIISFSPQYKLYLILESLAHDVENEGVDSRVDVAYGVAHQLTMDNNPLHHDLDRGGDNTDGKKAGE